MKVGARSIKIFKIKNRQGYAAVCCSHLTEGKTSHLSFERMLKALRRSKIQVAGHPVCPKRVK